MKQLSLYETYKAWNELYDNGARFVGYGEEAVIKAIGGNKSAIANQIRYCHVMDQVFFHEDEYLPFSQFHMRLTNEKAPDWVSIESYVINRDGLPGRSYPQTLYDRLRRLAKYDFEVIPSDCEFYWSFPYMELCPYFGGKLFKKIEWDRYPAIFVQVPLEGQHKLDIAELIGFTGRKWPNEFELVDCKGIVKKYCTATRQFTILNPVKS